MPAIPRYTPSGKFEPSTLPLALGFGLVGALGVGWLYQWFVFWVPFIYLNAVATAALGAAIGFLVGTGARMGKCRNLMLATIIALLCGVVAEGATMYYAYQRQLTKAEEGLQRVFQRRSGKKAPVDFVALQKKKFTKEVTFKKYIDWRVKHGWRLQRSGKINGVMVYIIWGIELLILIVLGVIISRGMIEAPFCERGNRWAEELTLGTWPGVEPSFLNEAAEVGDINAFIDVEDIPTDVELPTLAKYTVYLCDTVGYLSVTLTVVELNNKGESTENNTDILEYAMVDSSQVQHLRDVFGA